MASTPSLSDPHMPLDPIPIKKSDKPNQIDPATGRSVTYKKGNESMLVHQKWKREQEEKEKKRKLKNGGKSDQGSNFISKSLGFLIKWSLVGLLLSLAAGQFIKGDLIWGYRGKYVRKSYWLPVSSLHCLNCVVDIRSDCCSSGFLRRESQADE